MKNFLIVEYSLEENYPLKIAQPFYKYGFTIILRLTLLRDRYSQRVVDNLWTTIFRFHIHPADARIARAFLTPTPYPPTLQRDTLFEECHAIA